MAAAVRLPLPASSGTIPGGTSSGAGTRSRSGSGGRVMPGSGAFSALAEARLGTASGDWSVEQPTSARTQHSTRVPREIMAASVGPRGAGRHDGAVSTSWTTPDPRRSAPTAPVFGETYVAVAQEPPPAPKQDLAAAVLTVAVTLLAGAPVGLLWAAVAPKVAVVIDAGNVSLVRPMSDEFIAGDAYFLFAVALAGLAGGLLAWRLGRAHGPAVVVALTLGGLGAAYVAMVVGQLVGAEAVDLAVASTTQEVVELTLRLRAKEALVAWPVGSLLAYLGASFVRGR